MIAIDQDKKAALFDRGVVSIHVPTFWLPEDCAFEPPCNFKWIAIEQSIRMGAFSCAETGYFRRVEIGRYSSLEEGLQIGRGSHPIWTGSTSPALYGAYHAVTLVDDPRGERWNRAMDDEIKAMHALLAEKVQTRSAQRGGRDPDLTIIGNDVAIAYGAMLMPGVAIGDGAVVRPMAVVTKDVPPFAIVEGSPARVVGMRLTERYLAVRWWRFAFWDVRDCPVTDPEAFIDAVEARIADGMQEYRPKPVRIAEL
jgi:virginiamycin A acetyltransferase